MTASIKVLELVYYKYIQIENVLNVIPHLLNIEARLESNNF